VRRTITTVDADQQAAGRPRSLEEWITRQREWSQQHLVAMMFGAFAALALSLAAVGLYSVVSYTVAQRTNEFGIRMALGAERIDVLRMVFLSTASSVGTGVVLGIVFSLAMRHIIATWGVGSAINLVVLAAVSVVLFAVAAIACAVPARRASNISPMQALRYE
jgi:ABC-type antimicrobial peptide transport system permease subunit